MKKTKIHFNLFKIIDTNYFKIFVSFILTVLSLFTIISCNIYKDRSTFKIKNHSGDLYIDSIKIGISNYPLKQFENKYSKVENNKLVVKKGHYFKKKYSKNLNIYVNYSSDKGDVIEIINEKDSIINKIDKKENSYETHNSFKNAFVGYIKNIDTKNILVMLVTFIANSIIFYLIVSYIINFIKSINKNEKSNIIDVLKFELCVIYIYLFCLFILLKILNILILIPLLILVVLPIIFLRKKIDKVIPEVFVILVTFLGLFMTFLLPLFHVPDEASHYFKAYSIVDNSNVLTSNGFRSDKALIKLPKSSGVILDKYNMDIFNAGYKISANEFFSDISTKINDTGDSELFYFGNTYDLNAFCYLPSALIIFLGLKLSLPFIITVLFCRIINMLLFSIIGYYALKLLPKFKKIFLIVMLMPLTLHQAGAINQDSLTNTIFILIAALLINLYFSKKNSIDNKKLILLFVLSIFLGLCKTGYFTILLLILFIPKDKFESKKQRLIAKTMILAPCVILSFSKYLQVGTVTVTANVDYYKISDLINHPFMIINAIINTIFERGSLDLLTGLVDGFGWSTKWHCPLIAFVCVLLYSILILTTCEEKKHDYKFKIIAFIISLMTFGLIYASLLFGWTSYGLNFVDGLQCRYFIPVVLMLYISLSNNFVKLNFKNNSLVQMLMVIIVNILSFYTIIVGYYK